MDRRAWSVIGGLTVTVVVLSIALTVVITRDGAADQSGTAGTIAMAGMPMGGGHMGMMQAMARMDSDGMLERMREVLGENGYQRMLEHMTEHRQGGPMASHPDIDEMMHRMLDGMFELMPADRNGVMPMRPR